MAALQRSNLTRPQGGWWAASKREGLTARVLTDEEMRAKYAEHGWINSNVGGGEKWWTVEYSQRYKSLTKSFIQAAMSGRE